MNNFKSFLKQNLQLILLVLCGLLVVAGILVFVFGAANSDGALKGVLIAFGIALLALGCALLFYATTLGSAEQANFFLYDAKRKSNVPLEALSFEMVDRKMTYIMTKLVSSAAEVWTKNVFEDSEEIFGDDDAFKPLVAYKMLYDLSERANDEIWALYLSAPVTIINSLVSALELNGDAELGKAFKFLYSNASGNAERTQKFLADNVKYVQNKMLKYVKANISRF